ncbi:MAG: tetratricopeptide repeat protein [Armatimonadetes bacterium]|nr:tetratricopeptide repeat protein [Armatimonadota bacterium]
MRSAPSAGSAVASAPREIGYRQALRMAEIGRTQEALALFERIASSPRTASVIEPQTGLSLRERATYQSALCLKTLGRREEAIRAIQRLLSTRPSPIIRRQCERQLKRLHRGEANHAAFE